MTALTSSNRPERVTLSLSDKQLVFIRVGDELYEAELDGRSLSIRTGKAKRRTSEMGEPLPGPPEARTANIDTLLRCLALGVAPKPIPQGIKLEAVDNWGHFRQNTFLNVSITISESRVVEFNEDIQEQDESYY